MRYQATRGQWRIHKGKEKGTLAARTIEVSVPAYNRTAAEWIHTRRGTPTFYSHTEAFADNRHATEPCARLRIESPRAPVDEHEEGPLQGEVDHHLQQQHKPLRTSQPRSVR